MPRKKKKIVEPPKFTLKLKDRVIINDFGSKIKGTVVKKEKGFYWVSGDNGFNYPKMTIGKPKKTAYFYIDEKID